MLTTFRIFDKLCYKNLWLPIFATINIVISGLQKMAWPWKYFFIRNREKQRDQKLPRHKTDIFNLEKVASNSCLFFFFI